MPATADINIVYQDDDLVIVHKPSGLLCVPGLSEPDNLYDQVKASFANARVVHRLDMATSGLVIFALNYEAQKGLGRLFETRKINKTYRARIFGQLHEASGEIHSPLICDWPNRPKQKIDWIGGKQASTFFEKLRFNALHNFTEVKLTPHTGRTHQLRVHMMQLGHPILGDNFYAFEQARAAASRLCLHAEKLEFTHPISREPMDITTAPNFG